MERKILWVVGLIVLATFLSCVHIAPWEEPFDDNIDITEVFVWEEPVWEEPAEIVVERAPEIVPFVDEPLIVDVVPDLPHVPIALVQEIHNNNNIDIAEVFVQEEPAEIIVERVPEVIPLAVEPPIVVVAPESQVVNLPILISPVIIPGNFTPVHHGRYVVQVSANRNPDIAWRNLEIVRREFSNSDVVTMERTNWQLLHVIVHGVWGAEIYDVIQRLGGIGFNEVYIRRER